METQDDWVFPKSSYGEWNRYRANVLFPAIYPSHSDTQKSPHWRKTYVVEKSFGGGTRVYFFCSRERSINLLFDKTDVLFAEAKRIKVRQQFIFLQQTIQNFDRHGFVLQVNGFTQSQREFTVITFQWASGLVTSMNRSQVWLKGPCPKADYVTIVTHTHPRRPSLHFGCEKSAAALTFMVYWGMAPSTTFVRVGPKTIISTPLAPCVTLNSVFTYSQPFWKMFPSHSTSLDLSLV